MNMEINLKIKFDKHHNRTTTWDRPEMPYFIDNASGINTKRTRYSPKSMREEHKTSTLKKQKQFNPNVSNRKISTARKASNSKAKLESKPTTARKPISDKLKKVKKKSTLVEQHHLHECEDLRKSLPGISGKKVIQKYEQVLSENQRIELINQKTVYYVGIGTTSGQDDVEGRYLWSKHEQVGYRYELLEGLGRGAFGEVIKAFDHKGAEMVAVKIVRAGRQQMHLALNQINILMSIKEKDIENRKNILRIKDFIVFRRHICIITELLGANLYQLLQSNYFKPLDPLNVKAFAIQILFSLAFLKQQGVVHSDIKPENILMKQKGKVGIKVIDFGTSMFTHEASFTYIQSRFYRAPEVILGSKYGTPIDMWSFGCLLAQLSLGTPIFAGDNEQEQLSLILRSVELPSQEFLGHCKNTQKYFNKDLSPKVIKGKDGKAILPGSRPLSTLIKDRELCGFLEKILKIEPQHRLTPLQALAQSWVLDYFPQNMRKEHLNDILLRIKKEEGQQSKDPKSSRGHKRGNSDYRGGTGPGHKRRGSEGFF